MFNLGIAHLYGYTGKSDIKLASEWFEITNLPEGFVAASYYYESIGDQETTKKLRNRALNMGYGTEWRQNGRKSTGLGGAGGTDINLPWPTLPNGNKPQQW